ncbi:MAG: PIG-L family deacetylase [Patescibacteria group bacterium]
MKVITSPSQIGITSKSRIVGIFPHPDDEAFSSAGFLYEASRLGADVRLITMTSGEASTLRYGLKKSRALNVARERELFCAAKTMKVRDVVLGHFPDGKLKENGVKIKRFLEKFIFEKKPNFIITLEPHGIYGHPDHIALTKAIDEIYKSLWQKKNGFKLIYATVGEKFKASLGARALARIKVNPTKPNVELKLSKKDISVKIKTLRCHKTQFKFDAEFLKKWNTSKLIESEWFKI